MLTIHSIKEEVQAHNIKHIPLGNITQEGILEQELDRIKSKMKLDNGEDDYVMKDIGDGTAYIDNLIQNRDLWSSNWLLAHAAGYQILFITLSVYQDDFAKDLSSKVSQVCAYNHNPNSNTPKYYLSLSIN